MNINASMSGYQKERFLNMLVEVENSEVSAGACEIQMHVQSVRIAHESIQRVTQAGHRSDKVTKWCKQIVMIIDPHRLLLECTPESKKFLVRMQGDSWSVNLKQFTVSGNRPSSTLQIYRSYQLVY